MSDEKQKELGALWINQGPRGEYLTGNIEINGEKIKVVAFKNDNKKNPAEPDWRVLKSVPKENKTESVLPSYPAAEINPEDVPF
jgi:hypothetical protein